MPTETFDDIIRREGIEGHQARTAHGGPSVIIQLPPLSDHVPEKNYADQNAHRAHGISLRDLNDLGKHNAEDELDLHGKTAPQAYAALSQFLAHAMQRGVRVVQIVHGRGLHSEDGAGRLRGLTRYWLSHCPQVLAYCQPPRNTGTVKVLLRDRRRHPIHTS